MKKENNIKSKKNTTQYGEFISSYYKWLPMDVQKMRSKYLEDISKSQKRT